MAHAPTHSLQSPFINLPPVFVPYQNRHTLVCDVLPVQPGRHFTQYRKAECCTETSVSTRRHFVIVQKQVGFTINSSLPTAVCYYKTSHGHNVITREWHVKCLSLVILHCGTVVVRSLLPQKFVRPLRWDSDKEQIRLYRGILYFQKVIRPHDIRVNVMTVM